MKWVPQLDNLRMHAIIAIGAIFLAANAVGASVRVQHLPRSFDRAYGYAPRQVTRYNSRADVYSSDSLGHQSFPNPDRDFGIENLRSHPSD
jgi:hypothetical protein